MEWGHAGSFVWMWTAAAAAALFALAGWRRQRELARFGDPELVGRLVASLDPRMRLLKQALVLGAIALAVVALAQPHFRKKETLVERRGIDVIIAIDVSNSMLAKDISPSRLEKAKLELAGLVEALRGNRLGVVAFAGEALIQCPLTLDRGAVKMFLSTVGPNLVSYQGTDLGRAIATALQAFPGKTKDSKALILITDGDDHGKETDTFVKKAKQEGVRVFTIGIGTSDGSTVPSEGGGHKKDRAGNVVLSKLGEARLERIARETGGAYMRAARGELESEAIRRAISRIATKGFQSDWAVEYEENYRFFVALAFLLLACEAALPEGRKAS